MTEQDWDQFFGLVDKIVDIRGPWLNKAELIKRKANEFGAETGLNELLAWFEIMEDQE